MKRKLTLGGIGTLLVLVGVGFICPALAQLRDQGAMAGLDVALLHLGELLTLGGVAAAIYGVRTVNA